MIQLEIVERLKERLSEEIRVLSAAADEAKSAATHAESRAEDQHDTRSTEASYLAAGQFQRVYELKNMLRILIGLPLRKFSVTDRIAIGALVSLEREKALAHYFLCPVTGGYKVICAGKEISVITPQSNLGQELVDKKMGDEIEILSQPGKILIIKNVQ